eukprot:776238-Prorocentrum_minimum.AAC.2
MADNMADNTAPTTRPTSRECRVSVVYPLIAGPITYAEPADGTMKVIVFPARSWNVIGLAEPSLVTKRILILQARRMARSLSCLTLSGRGEG